MQEKEKEREAGRKKLQQINNNNNNKNRKSCCINAIEAKTHKCNKYGSALQFIKSKTKGAIVACIYFTCEQREKQQ